MNPALTPDQTFPISNILTRLPSQLGPLPTSRSGQEVDLGKVPSAQSILKYLPAEANQTYLVYTKVQKLSKNHNIPFGYFNQTTWRPQRNPYMPLIALSRNLWDSNQFYISTGPDPVWVDLVVNNLDEGSHPFHLVSL